MVPAANSLCCRAGGVGPGAGGIDGEGAVAADGAGLRHEGGGAVDVADGERAGGGDVSRRVGLAQIADVGGEHRGVVGAEDVDGESAELEAPWLSAAV